MVKRNCGDKAISVDFETLTYHSTKAFITFRACYFLLFRKILRITKNLPRTFYTVMRHLLWTSNLQIFCILSVRNCWALWHTRFYPSDYKIRTGSVALLLTAGSETPRPCVSHQTHQQFTVLVLLRERSVGKFRISCSMRYTAILANILCRLRTRCGLNYAFVTNCCSWKLLRHRI